jgi:hypothetical protein
LTQLERRPQKKWKTTWKKRNGRRPQTKMEDNLKKNKNGRQPNFDQTRKKTSKKKMEYDLKKNKMEDNLILTI